MAAYRNGDTPHNAVSMQLSKLSLRVRAVRGVDFWAWSVDCRGA